MKCPNCNVPLTWNEDIYYEFASPAQVEFEVAGCCPNCARKYRWAQYYTLMSEDDLEDDD